LRKQYPKAEIRVTVDVTEEIVAGLHDRRFDLGLISLPVPEENLKINPLFDEELLIAGPATGKARHGYSIRASDPYSILSLSQGDRPAGDQRSFLQGYRCDAAGL
jgi:LysR family hydrogen peroxide-inducible transcriptional activator